MMPVNTVTSAAKGKVDLRDSGLYPFELEVRQCGRGPQVRPATVDFLEG